MRQAKGFTLVEILLVMVIIAIVIVTTTTTIQQRAELARIDRTALQMQYLLNAGLAYYVANGSWPDPNDSDIWLTSGSASQLQPNYLAANAMPTQFDGDHYYHVSHLSTTEWDVPPNTFQVAVYLGLGAKQSALGQQIAGRLPQAHYEPSTGYVYAYVYPPGQDLNNATAMNFAGLYHHGACVPVPVCPTDVNDAATPPQVFLVPVSTSGVNDSGSTNVYPISSFSAYATGNSPLDTNPPLCTNQTTTTAACSGGGANAQYWRACMQVVTARGDVAQTRTDNWGQYVTMAAFTRCSLAGEPSGSGFTVYGN